MPLLRVENVNRVYSLGKREVFALKGVSFSVENAEFVSIMGPSGSGKSTLLNIMGCLDRPTGGDYYVGDRDVSKLRTAQLANLRGGVIGFVFQTFNLIPTLTARANVEVPLLYRGVGASRRRQMALSVLEEVGIRHRERHLPSELSGGEQQRVAVARALVTDPSLILADEPTGNLDSKSSSAIMGLFQRINENRGVTIIQVTHDPNMAMYGTRIIAFSDGSVVADEVVTDRLNASAARIAEVDVGEQESHTAIQTASSETGEGRRK